MLSVYVSPVTYENEATIVVQSSDKNECRAAIFFPWTSGPVDQFPPDRKDQLLPRCQTRLTSLSATYCHRCRTPSLWQLPCRRHSTHHQRRACIAVCLRLLSMCSRACFRQLNESPCVQVSCVNQGTIYHGRSPRYTRVHQLVVHERSLFLANNHADRLFKTRFFRCAFPLQRPAHLRMILPCIPYDTSTIVLVSVISIMCTLVRGSSPPPYS